MSLDQQGLVNILADMARSALAWERDHGAVFGVIQCASGLSVDEDTPAYTLSQLLRNLRLDPEAKEAENVTPESK